MSAIGKIGVRSSGPAGWPVPGCSGGSGSPGGAGSRVTQWVGMPSSPSTNLTVSVMAGAYASHRKEGWAAALVRRRGPEASTASGCRWGERNFPVPEREELRSILILEPWRDLDRTLRLHKDARNAVS